MQEPTSGSPTARNLGPILEALRFELRDARTVLEVGSGNGQHATGITAAMPGLRWQTSDRKQQHADIRNWLSQSASPRVLPPLSLDVVDDSWPEETYDAVFSSNTAHIMGMSAVERMFALASHVLRAGGKFCLYGPFGLEGRFNSRSNADFDRLLRSRHSDMGIRHLEELDDFAAAGKMRRIRLYTMPANNFLPVWQKTGGESDANA